MVDSVAPLLSEQTLPTPRRMLPFKRIWRVIPNRLSRASFRRGINEVPLSRRGDSIVVLQRDEVTRIQRWASSFKDQRKDWRYYEIIEDTIQPEFQYRYFVIQNERAEVLAVQPFFVLNSDLLSGVNERVQGLATAIRRIWPRFMRIKTLMVGCAAGEGHLDEGDNDGPSGFCAKNLIATVLKQASIQGARLVVLKEFPTGYRQALKCFLQRGFIRLPSLPMTSVSIDYPSFDLYVKCLLGRSTRKDLRRKLRRASTASIQLKVMNNVEAIVDEIFPLYLQVYDRSKLRFEKLTKEYLCELGRRMPEKVRFFVWRRDNRVVAFSLCMIHGNTIYDEYIGLDYGVAFDLHLYHLTYRDIVTWAIANGYKTYMSSGLNYAPKLHLGHRLEPLDLYVRHTSSVINVILKLILPFIAPTRFDKHLKSFPNCNDLWGDM